MFREVKVQRGFDEVEEVYGIATEHRAVIAGGYARYMCSTAPEVAPAGDIDLFPREDCDIHSLSIDLIMKGYKLVREGRTAYSMVNDIGTKVQIIKPVQIGKIKTFGTVEEILSFFDFSVVSVAITSPTTALADNDFECHEFCHELRLRTVNSPIACIARVNKYAARGYWFPPTEALRLFQLWDSYSVEYRTAMTDFLQNREAWTQEEIDEGEEMLWFGDEQATPAADAEQYFAAPLTIDDIPF